MPGAHLASSDESERGRAVQRLRMAIAERSRVREARAASDGKANDVESASRSAADDQVAARKRRLESVDDGDY